MNKSKKTFQFVLISIISFHFAAGLKVEAVQSVKDQFKAWGLKLPCCTTYKIPTGMKGIILQEYNFKYDFDSLDKIFDNKSKLEAETGGKKIDFYNLHTMMSEGFSGFMFYSKGFYSENSSFVDLPLFLKYGKNLENISNSGFPEISKKLLEAGDFYSFSFDGRIRENKKLSDKCPIFYYPFLSTEWGLIESRRIIKRKKENKTERIYLFSKFYKDEKNNVLFLITKIAEFPSRPAKGYILTPLWISAEAVRKIIDKKNQELTYMRSLISKMNLNKIVNVINSALSVNFKIRLGKDEYKKIEFYIKIICDEITYLEKCLKNPSQMSNYIELNNTAS